MNPENSITNQVNICHAPPPDKRKYIADLGKILLKDYGKKKYYKTKQVKEAHKKSTWADNLDFSCWGMSVFSSHGDFDRHHEATGEVCDYTEMKTTMLEGISTTDATDLTSIPVESLDASWLDLGELFEGVFEGVGEFFAGILGSIDL